MREYMIKRYHERRDRAIAHLGGCCKACGSRDQLELDHINPEHKEFDLAKNWSVSEERFSAELVKCQLLCKECHKKKSLVDNGFKEAKGTHGTLSAYRYCGPPKCAACKSAKSIWTTEYRKTHPRK
jgi:hypothetical protein